MGFIFFKESLFAGRERLRDHRPGDNDIPEPFPNSNLCSYNNHLQTTLNDFFMQGTGCLFPPYSKVVMEKQAQVRDLPGVRVVISPSLPGFVHGFK